MSNNKYKILVVEDDRSILSMIQTVLDTNGYQVLTAQRCRQGILMLTSHMPDLVVLDLGLPDMDGEEFIRVARRSSMIPIIVLSARSDEQDKMGANIGTTVTAWILSLGGISSDNLFLQLLKPTSFTPVLALIGTIFLMFSKSTKRKDVGTILLGFATLMFGMDTMSGAVSGLADIPAFQNLFLMFENPVLGVLVGAVLTGIIQSSSASVGILQALSATGAVSYAAAIPIIMGQNIGTCVTALLSSFGANKNAKRAAYIPQP